MTNNSSDKPLTELDTTNPATAAANPNLTQKQVDMAATPAAKQGIDGIQSPFTNKGNIHVPKSADSIFKTAEAPTPDTKSQEKAQGIADAQRTKQLDSQRAVVEADRQAAQERLAASKSLRNVGGIASSIQNQLASQVDRLFSEESSKLQGEGLSAIAGSEELRKQMTLPEESKAVASTALDEIYKYDQELDNLTEAAAGSEAYNLAQQNMTAAVGKLATALGSSDGKVTWDQVKGLFPDQEKLLGVLASSSMADQITVDSQMLNDLGYDTDAEKEEITKLLGLTGKESVTEFRSKVDSYLNSEYKEVSQLENQLRDRTLSTEEREDILNRLKDLGYTGTLAARSDVTQTYNNIKDIADQSFKFAGREMTMEEALSDASVTGAVSDYLAGRIERGELPEALADFVDENKDVFEDAMADLKDEVQQYNTTQEEWRQLSSLQLDPKIMETLGFDPNSKIQSKRLNTDSMALLKGILPVRDKDGNLVTPPTAVQYQSLLTKLSSKAPAMLPEILANLKPADVEALTKDPILERDYMNSLAAVNNMAAIKARMTNATAEDDLSGDEIIGLIFGQDPEAMATGKVDAIRGMRETLDKIKTLQSAGITDLDGAYNAMLAVGDVTDGKALYDKLAESLGDSVTDLSGFSSKLKNGIAAFTSAAGSVKELSKYDALIDGLNKKSGTGILSGLQALGKIKGQDMSTDVREAMKYLPRDLPEAERAQMRQQIVDGYVGGITKNADALLAGKAPGQDWTSPGSRDQMALGMNRMADLLTSDVPEARALAKNKLKEYSKLFTDKRSGMSWRDVLGGSASLAGWVPPVDLPGFEEAFKSPFAPDNKGFYPVKGGARGDTDEYNPTSQNLVEAITEYAKLNGKPLNQNTANEFAIFWKAVNS